MVNVLERIKQFFIRKRPPTCESCGKPTETIHLLDETWRGKFPEGRKIYLCSACLRDSLKLGFAGLRSRCLIAEPVSESNAYYAYTGSDEDMTIASGAGEDVLEHRGLDKKRRDRARQALTKLLDGVGGNCNRCEKEIAVARWVPAPSFKGKWTDFDLTALAELDLECISLCGECTTDAVMEAVDSKGIRLDEVWLPAEGTVLMFSGEA